RQARSSPRQSGFQTGPIRPPATTSTFFSRISPSSGAFSLPHRRFRQHVGPSRRGCSKFSHLKRRGQIPFDQSISVDGYYCGWLSGRLQGVLSGWFPPLKGDRQDGNDDQLVQKDQDRKGWLQSCPTGFPFEHRYFIQCCPCSQPADQHQRDESEEGALLGEG